MTAGDWTSLADWVLAFREVHEKARRGKLSSQELEKYEQEREALAQALIAGQRLSMKPGQTARQTLRVVLSLPVELVQGRERGHAATLDLTLRGFAVLLAKPVRVSERVEFSLRLRSAGGSVKGRARVVNLQRKGKLFRVAFAFENLSANEMRRVSFEVFDAALANIPPSSS
jgi:PilZ domain